MKKKFLIFSPSYKEISGGVVVLHKLCSILNDLGYESYLHPYVYSYELNRNNYKSFIVNFVKWSVRTFFSRYKTNPTFNTPIFKGSIDGKDDWVVIYPEVVFGNPLNAKNVVRWLLHQPGYHEGNIYYGEDELYFKFNSAIMDFHFHNSVTSKNQLKVIHYPLEYYNMEGASVERAGTAYCLRKGRNKDIIHELGDSILIDGKTHAEVSEIFKRVKTFVSYDTYTAYSIFAVLCGCNSVVVPDVGVSEEEWYPNFTDRYGLSYGLNHIEKASETSHLVKEHVEKEIVKVIEDVKGFILEVDNYFK
ncbi:MAG: WavQ [Colwellia sp.]|jgi:hypothetical protein